MLRSAVMALPKLMLSAGVVLLLAACDAPLPPREVVPKLAVDAGWPTIPAGAKFGEVSAVDVDAQGNVWVLHRAGRVWAEPFPTDPIAEPTVFMSCRDCTLPVLNGGSRENRRNAPSGRVAM